MSAAAAASAARLDRSGTSRYSSSRRLPNFDDSLQSLELSARSGRGNPQNPQSDSFKSERSARARARVNKRAKSTRNTNRRSSRQTNDDSFRSNEAPAVNAPSPSWMPHWLKPVDQARRSMGRFINCDRFQYFILILITINAIMMGVATFPFVKSNPQISNVFELIDKVFLVIFTIESGLQLLYQGWYIFKDGFLVFDLLIVILSWALEGTQVIRSFRIFRALRLVTRVETMRNLVLAMFDVMPKLGAIFALLALVFYIFGVMMTQLYKDLSKQGDDPMGYFSSLPRTLFTLFQIMCLDEWASVYDTVSEFYWWSWIPFIAFIVITAFVVINLVVAVICDVVSDLDKEGQAGLYGFNSEAEFEMARNRDEIKANKKQAVEKRMKELHQQIETMVQVQDRMRLTTLLLAKKLRDNAMRFEEEDY
ncbi:hypothetical protein ACHAWO_009249 [Cyclotella atomus]|uniref:Ion transport domain-containing protein n=1 Tax=Cyclotella atomus TaxID=382360 RepID=A0ABD3Q500_9STRA